MEGLAPPLKCLIEIQSSIQSGETIRAGLLRYLQGQSQRQAQHQVQNSITTQFSFTRHGSSSFDAELRQFLFAYDQGQDWKAVILQCQSPQRRALLEIVAIGLAGQPVQTHLEEVKGEIIEACDSDIRRHLELLPVLMLAPLLLFQFPAFLLLLFGPLLNQLLLELSR